MKTIQKKIQFVLILLIANGALTSQAKAYTASEAYDVFNLLDGPDCLDHIETAVEIVSWVPIMNDYLAYNLNLYDSVLTDAQAKIKDKAPIEWHYNYFRKELNDQASDSLGAHVVKCVKQQHINFAKNQKAASQAKAVNNTSHLIKSLKNVAGMPNVPPPPLKFFLSKK